MRTVGTIDQKDALDLEGDLRHLYHLLDTLCEHQFGAPEFDRDRCDALLWIARDRAEKCAKAAHHLAWPGDMEASPCAS